MGFRYKNCVPGTRYIWMQNTKLETVCPVCYVAIMVSAQKGHCKLCNITCHYDCVSGWDTPRLCGECRDTYPDRKDDMWVSLYNSPISVADLTATYNANIYAVWNAFSLTPKVTINNI